MAATIAALAVLLVACSHAAAADSGFCCWVAEDETDFCGTCLPAAVAGPTSYCSKSPDACSSCGKAQWCEPKPEASKQIVESAFPGLFDATEAGTELLLSFNASEAPSKGSHLSLKIGGNTYGVSVVESDFEAFPTPAPTAEPTAAPTPEPPAFLGNLKAAPAQGTLKPNVDAVEQHGRLRVDGNKIVGEHGLPVRLRGMSMFWSQWMGQFWNRDAIRWLKEDWHVSFIRAAMGVEQGGYLDNPDEERAKLEAVVDACIQEGIYVVIDWHDYHAEDHVEDAKRFFSEMARKYGDKPNVLFETYNEPQQISWPDTIKPYHEQIVPVIREHSDNIIILGTRTWSQEVDVAAQDPVSGGNLAYTIHFYAASMGADLRSKVSAALASGAAIFATEWGTCEYTGDGRVDLGETQAWLDFMEENHISDSNWGVSDKEESCSALRPGAGSSGGWSEGDLTESGAFVRGSIREYNSAEPLESPAEMLSSVAAVGALMRKHSMRGPLPPQAAPSAQRGLAAAATVAVAAALLAGAALAARRASPMAQSFLALDQAASDSALSPRNDSSATSTLIPRTCRPWALTCC